MTWSVPKIWEGGECWIIGGGPSVTEQFEIPKDIVQGVRNKDLPPSAYSPYLVSIHGKHVIGINAAYLIGDWIDMVFFGDRGFFVANRKQLAEFPGLKVTCCPGISAHQYDLDHIKYLQKDRKRTKGISRNSSMVSWNANSGAAAISVAVHAGVTRIVLLGFDMKLGEGDVQHWHNLYKKDAPPRKRRNNKPNKAGLPFHRHLLGFPVIAKDAHQMGIEILNASPDSAITDFRKCTVKELLCG